MVYTSALLRVLDRGPALLLATIVALLALALIATWAYAQAPADGVLVGPFRWTEIIDGAA